MIEALKARDLWPKTEQRRFASTLSRHGDEDDRSWADEAEKEYERFQKAFAILRAAVQSGKKPTAYLKGRGIDIMPPAAMLLPAAAAKRLTGVGFPAMVLPVSGDTRLKGALVVSLTKDGSEKLRSSSGKVRRLFGPIKAGYAQLSEIDPDKPLIIAEGVETALAAMQLTGLPGVAALSEGNMKAVNPPTHAEYVIAADSDEIGIRAAEVLAARLSETDATVRIAVPEPPRDWTRKGFDWNDALVEARRAGGDLKGLRRSIVRAPRFAQADATARRLVTRALDRFEYRELQWLWHPYFPRGAVTLVYGFGGVGKSSMLLDLAARITKGRALPRFGNESEERAPKGTVLMMSKEDDPNIIVRPRAEAAKADISRIQMVGYETPADPDSFDPLDRLDTNVELLAQKVKGIGDVRLIIIDPMTDFTGALDIYRDDQIRSLLTPLSRLAAQHDLAVAMVLHVNKKSDFAAHQRALGGVAFVNVARSAVLVAEDPDDPDRKFVVQVKGNLTAKTGMAAAFRMKTVRAYARIEWEPELVEQDAGALLTPKASNKQSSKLQQAEDWLRELLLKGPRLAREIEEIDAKAAGISESTLKRAKQSLSVISTQAADGWWWALPEAAFSVE